MRYVVRVTKKDTTYHFFDNFREAVAWMSHDCRLKFSAALIKSIENRVCQAMMIYKLWNNAHYELEWIDIEKGNAYERIYILEQKLDQLLQKSSSPNACPSNPTSAEHTSAK